jgi:hypothetical protein
MSRLLFPIAYSLAGGAFCGAVWFGVMVACGIPVWFASKAAAVGTAYAVFWMARIAIEKDS